MRYLSVVFLLVICLACGNSGETDTAVQEKPTEFKTKVQFDPVVSINNEVRKDFESWEDYRNLETFMKRFTNASPEEILSNALELRNLVKATKFSDKIPELYNIPPIKARFNILYNQTLRLSDMTFIPAIKAEEVIEENKKILLTYSSINSRFISIVSKKRFEDEIDIDIQYIGLDSTKIDSISRKTINKTLKAKKKKEDSLKKTEMNTKIQNAIFKKNKN
ncbi:MAG: hypothetical protein CMB99_09170 [Flavobacteriaceae bacterium]|nr:hypothetical protein [Flavobacteriaceae bacterium]